MMLGMTPEAMAFVVFSVGMLVLMAVPFSVATSPTAT